MKTMMRIGLMTALLLTFGVVSYGQEMTKDQWQQAMREATQKRDSLRKAVDDLGAAVVKLKTQDNTLSERMDQCQKDLLGMLGATEAQVKEYSAMLDRIDAKLNELSKLSNQDLYLQRAELDSVQAMIGYAKDRRLSYLPENAQRLQEEQYRLDALRESLKKIVAMEEKTYTVGTWAKNRDCLWNIAKKPKIYDNAFLWPKIWQDNRDQIKNPDIIRTGQKLRIPSKAPLTAQEQDALKSYWHRKTTYASSKRPVGAEK
jgi:small-conductance mechanosensitive channel